MASNRTASFQQSLSAVAPTNFLNNGHAEANTAYWDVYADAAGLVPVDGDLGSPNVVLTRTTTLPLLGDGSFLLTKDAANRQGEGASTAFGIGVKDQSHVINIDFDYSVVSGTFAYNGGTVASPSDIAVYVYDMINNVLIYPSQSFLDGSGKYHGQFQSASNSTVYRLILHIPTTSASAWAFKFDNVQAWRGPVQSGAVMSDWISYTPIWTTTGTPPAIGNGSLSGRYRRAGDSMDLQIHLQAGGTTTFGTGAYSFSLPSGLSIDTSKISGTAAQYNTVLDGNCTFRNPSVTQHIGIPVFGTTTTIQMIGDVEDLWTSASPATADTDSLYRINISELPISGWSSNLVVSSDYGNRVVAGTFVTNTTAVLNTTSTVLPLNSTLLDTTASKSGNTYVIPESGIYLLSSMINVAGTVNTGYISTYFRKNGAGISYGATSQSSTTFDMSVTNIHQERLSAGDIIDTVVIYSQGGSKTLTGVTNITKIQSPQTLAGGEVVAFQGRNTAATVVGTSFTTIPFTSVKDTHGSWSTNQYTVSQTGFYDMAWGLYTGAANLTTAQLFATGVFIDGVFSILGFEQYGSGVSRPHSSVGAVSAYYLTQGQVITLRAIISVSTNLQTTVGQNYFTIAKVG